MEARTETIFAGDHLRLYLRSRGFPVVVVTFDHWRRNRSGFPTLSSGGRFLSRGFDFIRVDTAHNDWFLNSDLDDVRFALTSTLAVYQRVVFLGFSMGTSGSLLLLNAARSASLIAVSPTFPPLTAASLQKVLHTCMRLRTIERAILVYDNMIAADTYAVMLLKQWIPHAELASVRGGGHPATDLLVRNGQYDDTLNIWLGTNRNPGLCLK